MNDQLEAISDLLGEVDERNHLTIIHYPRGAARGSEVEVVDKVVMPASLHLVDRVRMLAGRKPVYLAEAYRRLGGDLVGVFPNLRTNVGIDYAAAQLGGAASTTVAKYIAVSNNTNAASAANTATNTTSTRICWGTDTTTDAAASTTRGEYSFGGVARAAATYAHTGSVASYSQTITYTATTALTALQAAGMFDSATKQTGTLFVESVFTATTLANTDQLSIAWTINI
jgi:hypothetical protein